MIIVGTSVALVTASRPDHRSRYEKLLTLPRPEAGDKEKPDANEHQSRGGPWVASKLLGNRPSLGVKGFGRSQACSLGGWDRRRERQALFFITVIGIWIPR